MTKPLRLLPVVLLTLGLAACAAPGAPAGSGPIANPLGPSCPPIAVPDPSAYNDDGTLPDDVETADWPSSTTSKLADEFGLQDVITDSCYYDYADAPYKQNAEGDGGFFVRIDPESADVTSYFDRMDDLLSGKGYEVTLEDDSFEASSDDAGVGAYFIAELTDEMLTGAQNPYAGFGLEAGDSLLYGVIGRNEN